MRLWLPAAVFPDTRITNRTVEDNVEYNCSNLQQIRHTLFSMSQTQQWCDLLSEKHECGPMSTRVELVQTDGETIRLHVPQWVPRFELVEFSRSHEKLYLILKDLESVGWDEPQGIVAIATQKPDGSFAAILWHYTYP